MVIRRNIRTTVVYRFTAIFIVILCVTLAFISYGSAQNDKEPVPSSVDIATGILIDVPASMKEDEMAKVSVKFKLTSPKDVGVIEVRPYGDAFNIVSITPERQFVESDKFTEWQLQITPRETGNHTLYLSISKLERMHGDDKEALRTIATFERVIAVKTTTLNFLTRSYQWFVSLLAIIIAFLVKFLSNLKTVEQFKKSREEIARAESKVEAQPQKVKPAWDLARVTLEAYFNRNLSQISSIFWLSVVVMLVGFCIIVWGITQASQANKITPGAIAALAGVITEFIGATFLFIYRSTIQQAINYSKTLERINSVGMAMQILDTMPDETKSNDLKSQTKAALVKLLVEHTAPIDMPKESEKKKATKKDEG